MSERAVRRLTRWASAALPVWFLAMTVFGVGMLARHTIALPAPTREGGSSALAATLQLAPNRWTAVHVLAAGCRCSRNVAEHLEHDPRPSGWVETVAWIGDAASLPPLPSSFRVKRIDALALAQLGVDAAPLLVVIDPSGEIVYSGGYTDTKQGRVVHDVEILDRARAGQAPEPLPLFGCATSARVENALARLPVPGGLP